MKTKSPESAVCRTDEMAKSTDNCGASYNADQQLNSDNNRPVPDTMTQTASEKSSKNEIDSKDADGPGQILTWISEALKALAINSGTTDIKELEKMISTFLGKVSSCISKCYVPNRAAKMKRHMSDVLLFFNFVYQEIAEETKVDSTYLDTMAHLMAYYIDMEIQASSRAKENPLVIASKITSCLYIFLDKSHNHILDSMLKANNMNKNFWELASLIFSGVLKDSPSGIMDELTYVRYILVYKMWKRVVQGADERKKIVALASRRLKHPPQFVDKIRAGLLNGIIPKIPRKRTDVTSFLIQAKFDVKEKAKAFLKYVSESKNNVMFVPPVPAIKVDIPLLVGHLPDFGPSPSFVLSQPLELDKDEDDPQKIGGISSLVKTSASDGSSVQTFGRSSQESAAGDDQISRYQFNSILDNCSSPSISSGQCSADSGVCSDTEYSLCNETDNETSLQDTYSASIHKLTARNDASVFVWQTKMCSMLQYDRKHSKVDIEKKWDRCGCKKCSDNFQTLLVNEQNLLCSRLSAVLENSVLANLIDNEANHSAQDPNLRPSAKRLKIEPVDCQMDSLKDEHNFYESFNKVGSSDTGSPHSEMNSDGYSTCTYSIKREYDINIVSEGNMAVFNRVSTPSEPSLTSTIVRNPSEIVLNVDHMAQLPTCESNLEINYCKTENANPRLCTNSDPLAQCVETRATPKRSPTSQQGSCETVFPFAPHNSLNQPVILDTRANKTCSPNNDPLIVQTIDGQIKNGDYELNCPINQNLIPAEQDSHVNALDKLEVSNVIYPTENRISSNLGGGCESRNMVPTRNCSKSDSTLENLSSITGDLLEVGHKTDEKDREITSPLHFSTSMRDVTVFCAQNKFRDMFTSTNHPPPPDTTPLPTLPNPLTENFLDRCQCDICKGNFDVVCSNYRLLDEFARKYESSVVHRAGVFGTERESEEIVDRVDERTDYADAAGDLPLKKRKIKFAARLDERRKDESETIVYPSTPMLSIACLAETDLLGTTHAPIIDHKSSHSDSSHMSRNCVPVTFSTKIDNFYPATSTPSGGGFPPICSVITHGTMPHIPVEGAHLPETNFKLFKTPAELKAMSEPCMTMPTTNPEQLASTDCALLHFARTRKRKISSSRRRK